jgi:hypothetical protein
LTCIDAVYFEQFRPPVVSEDSQADGDDEDDDEDEFSVTFKFLQRMNSALIITNTNGKDHQQAVSYLASIDLEVNGTVSPDNVFASPKADEDGNVRNCFVACVAPRRAQIVYPDNDDDSLTYKTVKTGD